MKQNEIALPIEEINHNQSAFSNGSYKTDPTLGKKIYEVLKQKGVTTPRIETSLALAKRKEIIESSFKNIMIALGLNINDDSMKETPMRVAKMYLYETFYGLDYNNFPKCTAVKNKMNYRSMVIERSINIHSTCEHHFVPIQGAAHIAYIPKDKIIGLSKINRIVDFFSKRPQIQERLTEQIYFALQHILKTEDIAILIKASHHCVIARGIKDINSDTVTSKVGGTFLYTRESREEFLDLVRNS